MKITGRFDPIFGLGIIIIWSYFSKRIKLMLGFYDIDITFYEKCFEED